MSLQILKKIDEVKEVGCKTEQYKTGKEIAKDTNNRMTQAKKGTANMGYNWKKCGWSYDKSRCCGGCHY
ncbi:MAG: hypothetical protein R3Y63_04520 [Eubacteriales bacterium]